MLDRKPLTTRVRPGVKRPAGTPAPVVASHRPAPPPKVRVIKGSSLSETPAVNDSTSN